MLIFHVFAPLDNPPKVKDTLTIAASFGPPVQ